MPELDSAAQAATERSGFARADFIYLDLVGGPLRITTFDRDVPFSGTGDPDLDGHTFVAWAGALLEISDVSNSDSGSETRVITLSGIAKDGLDLEMLNLIGDRSLWQGRLCRTWFQVYDETGTTKQGALVADYTGYMTKVPIKSSPEEQQINLQAETYLAFTFQASNRSYLNQRDYDPNDTSAAATIAAANGLRRSSGATSGPPPAGGSGGSTGTIGDWGYGDRFSYGTDWPSGG